MSKSRFAYSSSVMVGTDAFKAGCEPTLSCRTIDFRGVRLAGVFLGVFFAFEELGVAFFFFFGGGGDIGGAGAGDGASIFSSSGSGLGSGSGSDSGSRSGSGSSAVF